MHPAFRFCLGQLVCIGCIVTSIVAIASRDREPAIGYPTAPEASHSLYARGHSSHFTAWVQYTLSPDVLRGRPAERLHTFLVDEAQPSEFRWSAADYHGSPYDIGHLCEAAVVRSAAAMREGFLLTNTMPQDAALNRGQWRMLEEYLEGRGAAGETVTICCGPAFLPDDGGTIKIRTIGEHRLWVPTHCWKAAVFVRRGELLPHEALAWLMPNRDVHSFWKWKTSVDELEGQIGFDLFDGVEEKLEE